MARPGTFPKGKSGNPSGRPKKTPELIEVENLCKEASPRAVARLIEVMESGTERAVIAACSGILANAFGTPKQRIEVAGKDGGAVQHVHEIRRTLVDPRNPNG